jgi:hypothetical protein
MAARSREESRRRVLALDYRRAMRTLLHDNDNLAVLSVPRFLLVERLLGCSRSTFGLWVALPLRVTEFRRQ